jgi:octaprenyl-diphosphate synthase
LHDDVIDDANTRRGQPSINALFDNKTSIMFGDILYSKAFTQLTFMPQDIAYHISNSVTLLSVGEMIDVDLSDTFNTSYELYLDMIYKKTASLIEASSRSAAIMANKDEESFASYGKNLGIAFQMIDDILDITSNSDTLGKPAMHDLKEGKVTIPYLLLLERLEEKDKNYLKTLYKKELNKDEIIWIRDNMQRTNSLKDAINLANKYGKKAIDSISNYKSKDLEDIILSMINRDF